MIHYTCCWTDALHGSSSNCCFNVSTDIFVPDDIKMGDCPKEQVEAQNLLSKDNTGDTNPALNDEKGLL